MKREERQRVMERERARPTGPPEPLPADAETPLQRSIRTGAAKHYDGGPVPKGWKLCCPFCEWWGMRPGRLSELPGFYCAGGNGLLRPICGRFLSRTAVMAHKGLWMVEE